MAVPAAASSEGPAAERSAASLETAVVEDRRSDYLDRLCREVTRTLGSSAGDQAFRDLYLTGRGSRVPGLRERLADRLGLDVRPLDLFTSIPSPVPPERLEEANAVYATALGAAARALSIGPHQLDLRREDLAFSRRFDQVKGALAASLALLLVAIGFLLWRAKTEKESAQADFGAMISELRRTSDTVERYYRTGLGEDQFGKLPKMPEDPFQLVPVYRKRAGSMAGHLKNELGLSTEVPPITSSLEIFKVVNRAIADVRDQLEYCLITNETYGQRDVQISVILSTSDHVDILKAAFIAAKLEDRVVFSSADYGPLTQDRNGKWPATFTLRLAKPGAEE